MPKSLLHITLNVQSSKIVYTTKKNSFVFGIFLEIILESVQLSP